MLLVKILIAILNDWKNKFYLKDDEGLTDYDGEELKMIPRQNPYGIIAFLLGSVSFIFGPILIILPTITILFSVLTYWTFDKEKEDNPWIFYIGFCLALIGLYMNIKGYNYQIVL